MTRLLKGPFWWSSGARTLASAFQLVARQKPMLAFSKVTATKKLKGFTLFPFLSIA